MDCNLRSGEINLATETLDMNKPLATQPSPTISQRLADYIHDEQPERIDTAAIARAKHLIVYHVGLAFRALKASETDSQQAISVARELSENCGSSTIIGTPYKATLVDAALANCTLMRSFGLDDVIFPAGIHPGLVTLPVALSIAERERSSGAELLTAIVVAYEVLGKFGKWTWSADTPRRATMPFGTFGSIAAASRLLRLTREQTANALGYAAHTAMGLAEGDAGPITHYYSMVCRNGITGAYLAKAGGWSSPTVLEGRFGFLESFLGDAQVDVDQLIDSLGHDYVVLDSCEKRYPGTALNQVPIELLRGLITQHRLTPADIAEIHIDYPSERRNFQAGHSTGPFLKRINAGSSIAFQLSMLLLDGELRPERNDELTNPEILDLVRKFQFKFVQGKPIRYARLEVRTNTGPRLVAEGDDFRYPPEDPAVIMERDAGEFLSRAKIARFLELLESLEQVEDASELVKCLVR